jgi:hypothetical protein
MESPHVAPVTIKAWLITVESFKHGHVAVSPVKQESGARVSSLLVVHGGTAALRESIQTSKAEIGNAAFMNTNYGAVSHDQGAGNDTHREHVLPYAPGIIAQGIASPGVQVEADAFAPLSENAVKLGQ